MSDDEKRTALLHAIAAWREAADEHPPGSPEYQYFQNKKTLAQWSCTGSITSILRKPSQALPSRLSP